jgi:drug/metabolite transporter (DMT)-like permease
MPAVKMSLLLYCTPFCTAVLSYFLQNERLSVRQVCGLCLGFVGIIPLFFVQESSGFLFSTTLFLLPELAVIAAVMAHSYSIHCTQQLIKTYEYPTTLVSAIGSLGGGLLALITAIYVHDPFVISDKIRFFPSFFVLVFVCNVVCNTWYIRLLKRHSITFLSLSDYLNPLFVAFYSWLLLGETVTWHYACAAVFIGIGLYIFNRNSK